MNTQPTPPVVVRTVQFSLSRWDIVRCRLWVMVHNGKLMAILLLMCVGVPFLNYQRPENVRYPLLYCVFYFVITFALMACVMALLQVLFHIFWVFVNKNRGVVGEHTLEIREDGLLERTTVNESLNRWGGFHKIQTSRRYLFIFATDNLVHYVPFHSFGSAEAARDFRDELQRRANVG
jgi:hypothetical protein